MLRPVLFDGVRPAAECAPRLGIFDRIAFRFGLDIIGSLSVSRSTAVTAEDLCIACGMCCNGVIFADVHLQQGDSQPELQALGLRFEGGGAGTPAKFCQPCAAYDGARCRIYGQRPRYCREFECLLLKKFQEGRTSGQAALRQIRKARGLSDRVIALLEQLGDNDQELPLARRFQRTRDRLESMGMDTRVAAIYGELTVAMLDLNFLLSGVFYPG